MTNLKRRGTHTLTVGGKKINLLFNMRFWGLLDEAGYKLEDMDVHLDQTKGFMHLLKSFAAIIDASGKAYASKDKTEWNYSIDDIYEWFEDDMDKSTLMEVLEAMRDSKIMGVSLSDKNLGKKKGK